MPSFSVFDNCRSDCLWERQPYQSVDMLPRIPGKPIDGIRKKRDKILDRDSMKVSVEIPETIFNAKVPRCG
jgi:hypothetical protein